jgi:hypothetical protein
MLMTAAGEDDGQGAELEFRDCQRRRKCIEERTPWYPSTTNNDKRNNAPENLVQPPCPFSIMSVPEASPK